MPDKRRSISGQGGLVIESRQKPVSLRLNTKLNGGFVGLAGSPSRCGSKPSEIDGRTAAKWESFDRHVTLRVAPCTIACGSIRLNLSFQNKKSIRNGAIM